MRLVVQLSLLWIWFAANYLLFVFNKTSDLCPVPSCLCVLVMSITVHTYLRYLLITVNNGIRFSYFFSSRLQYSLPARGVPDKIENMRRDFKL
jgi:hypothetical protein